MSSKKLDPTTAERRRERWARNDRYRFELTFAAVDCACGGIRPRTSSCPDCGARPRRHDVDVSLQRRQRLSQRAIDALDTTGQDTTNSIAIAVPESFRKLGEVLSPCLRALQQFTSSDTDSGEEVVAAYREVADLRDQLIQAPPLRPWLFARNEAAQVATGLAGTLTTFAMATAAGTPGEAEALNAQAQHQLDQLGDVGVRVGELFDRWSTVSNGGSVGDLLVATASDLYGVLGAGSLEDIDAAASLALSNVIHRRPATGQGLAFMHHDLWVTVLGDREKFHEAIANLDRLVEQHARQFNDLLSRPAVVSELKEGILQLADQVQQTMLTIEAGTSDRQQVRAIVQLMHAMFEGPGRRFAGATLELVGKGTFEERLLDDGARVIELSQQDRQARESFYGFEKSFRVAYAHQNYSRTSNGITVKRRGKPDDVWTDDEVLDSLIAAIETTVALALVFSMRAQDCGVDIEPPAALEALDLDKTNLLAVGLSWAGCTEIAIEVTKNPTIRFTTHQLTTVMRVLISNAFPDASSAHVEVTSHSGDLDLWNLDLAGFREGAAATDEVSNQAGLLLALWRSTKNGLPVCSKKVLCHWAAARTTALIQSAEPDATSSLRELVQIASFARAIEEPGLERAVRNVKAFFRLALTNSVDEAARDGVQEINRFLLDTPPDLGHLS